MGTLKSQDSFCMKKITFNHIKKASFISKLSKALDHKGLTGERK